VEGVASAVEGFGYIIGSGRRELEGRTVVGSIFEL